MSIPETMTGVVLPGNSTVEFNEYDVPQPGHRQVLIEMKASSICGSDIRAIYREHLGTGPEAYQGVIAGHEPCGQIVNTGPGCRERRERCGLALTESPAARPWPRCSPRITWSSPSAWTACCTWTRAGWWNSAPSARGVTGRTAYGQPRA